MTDILVCDTFDTDTSDWVDPIGTTVTLAHDNTDHTGNSGGSMKVTYLNTGLYVFQKTGLTITDAATIEFWIKGPAGLIIDLDIHGDGNPELSYTIQVTDIWERVSYDVQPSDLPISTINLAGGTLPDDTMFFIDDFKVLEEPPFEPIICDTFDTDTSDWAAPFILNGPTVELTHSTVHDNTGNSGGSMCVTYISQSGFYVLTKPGLNITDADKIEFWVRGQNGVQINLGFNGNAIPKISHTIQLSNTWEKVEYNVQPADLPIMSIELAGPDIGFEMTFYVDDFKVLRLIPPPTTAPPTTAEPTTVEPTTVEPTTTAAPTTAAPTTVLPTTILPTTTDMPGEDYIFCLRYWRIVLDGGC
jgi:hypothetical protein